MKFVADPEAERTRHEIAAIGPAGSYRFEIQNHPKPTNPATSAIVANAVLSGIRTFAGGSGVIV